MPYRSMKVLQAWVDEFLELGLAGESTIRVLPQDGDEGADTGLVGVRLHHAPTEIYLQPPDADVSAWTVTFEPREDLVRLATPELEHLAVGMTTLASLCRFLQEKSDAYRPGT